MLSVKIRDIQLFSDHLVVYERENGLLRVIIYCLPAVGEPLERLQDGRAVDFVDPIYSVDPSESQFSSSILRFSYSSMKTPTSVYDYDMNTGISILKKIELESCDWNSCSKRCLNLQLRSEPFAFKISIVMLSVKIRDIQLFSDHLVVYERENGLLRVIIYCLPAVGEPLERLQDGRAVDFVDPIYSVDPSESQFSSSILRFSYSSMKTPTSVYDYDMNTGISILKKIELESCDWNSCSKRCLNLQLRSEPFAFKISIVMLSVKIRDIQLFSDHLVVYERENGLLRVIIYCLPAVGEPLERLQDGRAVDFVDPIYSVDPSESQFSSSILRFSYSSMKTPTSVYDYDMNTGISILKKIELVSEVSIMSSISHCM
ncbi:unnamed protein product [Ilex paraguariensis]|uniref:Peptidase S9A N-terminal domain-containing protein n=1 Tax=Ilex paraguariensis TaxID=185542 RepID=A0ABC8RDM6_9AQUA